MLWLKKTIPISLSFIAIFLVSFFWSNIYLHYDDSIEIIGEYSKNNHHHLNDTLRFICFLIFPLCAFFIAYISTNKSKVKPIKDIFNENQNNIFFLQKNYQKNFCLLFFCLVLLVNFLSLKLPDYKIDIFHEGQLLSGAINYELKDKLWTGSYINTSLFYDILNTKISWFLFKNQTIGAYRIFSLFLNYFFLFFVLILIYKISTIFNFSKNKENYFYVSLSIFCIYFYGIKLSNFPNYRDLFTIFFLICLINALIKNKSEKLNYFLIGGLSILSLLWSLDRGIFLNASMLLLVIVLTFKKKFLEISFIFLGIFIFWLLFFLIVGNEEFNAFMFNSKNILQYNEIWNGIIHPQPFSNDKNSSRASIALILFIINGIIITKYFVKKNNKLHFNTKLFLGLFYCLGIFYYKVGLSRSDGGHIVIGSSINYILFIILFLYELLNFNLKKLNFSLSLNTGIIILIVLTITLIGNLFKKTNSNFENFFSYKSRINDFVTKKDSFFLEKNYQNIITQLSLITKDHSCIQNFNYDPTMYYLLKKKSCTQYYLTFIIATEDDQKKFINQLDNINYLIIDKDKYQYKFSAFNRFLVIKDYLEKNFKATDLLISKYILLKKN
jgi:hypothetical protein